MGSHRSYYVWMAVLAQQFSLHCSLSVAHMQWMMIAVLLEDLLGTFCVAAYHPSFSAIDSEVGIKKKAIVLVAAPVP